MDADWITTSTLLEGLQGFEDEAWRRFAERFRGPVVAFARRQGLSSFEAEDVAQETLLAFANAYRDGRYEPSRGRLSHWLFGIARRRAQNARAADGARRAREDPAAGTGFWDEQAGSPASGAWDEEWERSLLEQCLERVRREVSATTVRAFELTVVEGRDARGAAEELGVPIKTVYNAKHRVLQRVRELRVDLESLT